MGPRRGARLRLPDGNIGTYQILGQYGQFSRAIELKLDVPEDVKKYILDFHGSTPHRRDADGNIINGGRNQRKSVKRKSYNYKKSSHKRT